MLSNKLNLIMRRFFVLFFSFFMSIYSTEGLILYGGCGDGDCCGCCGRNINLPICSEHSIEQKSHKVVVETEKESQKHNGVLSAIHSFASHLCPSPFIDVITNPISRHIELVLKYRIKSLLFSFKQQLTIL